MYRVPRRPCSADFLAQAGLVLDFETQWVLATQPQGGGFSYPALAMRFYAALRSLGILVDFLPPGSDLSG